MGAVLGPQDCWLLIRSLKTLGLRIAAQETNAKVLAQWLMTQPFVKKVYYPGLLDHPGHNVQKSQAEGYGGMISFELKTLELIPKVLKQIKVISFAESLGGVESLITYPWTQTHADLPIQTRESLGINDCLLRLSVGIEDVQDLIEDLTQAIGETDDVQG